MEFRDAEYFINMSLLYSKVPLIVVGSNGIGKSTMLKEMSKHFKNTIFTTGIEYGGIKTNIQTWKGQKLKNIVISDFQSILTRKQQIANSTIGAISMLITDGINNEILYRSDNTEVKGFTVNFVVGMTYMHLFYLISKGYYDFLDRCLIVPLDRDMSKVDINKPFKLEIDVIKKKNNVDSNIVFNSEKYKQFNPRHQEMIRQMIIGFSKMGVLDKVKNVSYSIFATELMNEGIKSEDVVNKLVSLTV